MTFHDLPLLPIWVAALKEWLNASAVIDKPCGGKISQAKRSSDRKDKA